MKDNFDLHSWNKKRYLKENKFDFDIKAISITYTNYGDLYGVYLYGPPSEDNPYNNWKEKLRGDEAREFIKGETGLELPYSYDYTPLDKIVDALKKKGYDAEHNDAMDVT